MNRVYFDFTCKIENIMNLDFCDEPKKKNVIKFFFDIEITLFVYWVFQLLPK